MNEQEFDNLWQKTTAEGKAHRLALQYPAWEHKRRQVRNGVVAVLVVGVMTAVTIPMVRPAVADEYPMVCCNRTNIDDAQWVSLASEMLTLDLM